MNKTTKKADAPVPVTPRPGPEPMPEKTWQVTQTKGGTRDVVAERMHLAPGNGTLVFMIGNDIVLALADGAWTEVALQAADPE